MTRHVCRFPVFLVAVVALPLGAATPAAWAEDEIPFDEANIFFELNDTDGDLGIHALIDGEPWQQLKIEDPNERRMLRINVDGRLEQQGLTELFFESAEPPFDELAPEDFFARFPAGEYEIEGTTLEGDELESTAELTHVMPAPPENVTVSRVDAAEDCDVVPLPLVRKPVTIRWEPVTTSHPDIGEPGVEIDVDRYQVVVERIEPEDPSLLLSVDLPSDVTEFTIPRALTASDDEFKFEILVREESGNQTAIESCFVVN